jgi:tol-pal system protein YbgF
MKAWRVQVAAGVVLALVVLVEGGCWGRKFFRAPGETLATSTKVDSLLRENATLKDRVARIERTLAEDEEFSRGASAQLKIDLEELKDQLNALQEMLREAEERESYRPVERRRTARPDTVGARMSPRAGETVVVGAPSSGGSRGDTLRSTARHSSRDTLSGAGGAADTAGAFAAPAPAPEELYRQIYLDFNRREYGLALDESQHFLDEYPDDPLAEEVLFIRGQCLMEQNNYLDALKEFSTLLQRYPRGKRAPGALLRMAISYDTLGQKEVAAGVARRLIKEYPRSEEATAAEERFGAILKE